MGEETVATGENPTDERRRKHVGDKWEAETVKVEVKEQKLTIKKHALN